MLPSFIKMLRSFRYAGRGIYFALRRENNFRYHLLATVGTLLTGWLTGFNLVEWCIVLMLIGMVYTSEILTRPLKN